MQKEEMIQKIEEMEKMISFSQKNENEDYTNLENKIKILQNFRTTATQQILALDSATNELLTNDINKSEAITNLQSRVTDLENNSSSIPEDQLNQIATNTQNITTNTNSISNLQNSVSDISSEMTSLNNNLTDISSNISSLNNDIANQNTEIDNLNNSISTVNSELNSIESSITNLSTNYTNLSSSINEISTDVASLETKSNTFEGNIQNIQTNIETLDNRVSAIENSGSQSNSSDLPETFNYFNKTCFKQNQTCYGLNENFFTLFFLCEPTSVCRIKFKADISIINEIEYSKTLNVILNDEVINSNTYSFLGTQDDTIEFEYDFYPQKINNNLIFKSTEKNSLKKTCKTLMKECKIEILGRNVTILNKDNSFLVFPGENNYYLTKNIYEKGYGKIMSIGDANWDTDFFELPRMTYAIDDANANAADKLVYNNLFYNFLPKITYDSVNDKYIIDSVNYTITCAFSSPHYSYISSSDVLPVHYTSASSIASNENYAMSTPGERDTELRNTCFIKYASNYMLCMNKIPKANTSQIEVTLNGESLPNKWVFCTPVQYNDWVTNTNHPYQCIGLDEYGHNYYFNQRIATYSVDLGIGAQTSAYGQPDGSINVYMSIANRIYKKVLTLNSETQQYELTSSTFFANGNAYIEGISDDYFIKKGETWFYVPPTTTSN